jgi:hypothetical protein
LLIIGRRPECGVEAQGQCDNFLQNIEVRITLPPMNNSAAPDFTIERSQPGAAEAGRKQREKLSLVYAA